MRSLRYVLFVSVICVLVIPQVVEGGEASPMGRLLSASIVDSGKLLLRFDDTSGYADGGGEQLSSSHPFGSSSSSSPFTIRDRRGRPVVSGSPRILNGTDVMLEVRVALVNTPLTIRCGKTTVRAEKGWQMLDRLYAYDGDDLGCTFREGRARFKLWAPVARRVRLLLFDGGLPAAEVARFDMVRGKRGVWFIEIGPSDVSRPLSSLYYQYEVSNPGRDPRRVLDPYAKSMAAVTVNSAGSSPGASSDWIGMGAIVDPAAVGAVDEFAGVQGYERREDAVIYEVHVRDFTADPAVEDELGSRWGSYSAFKAKLPYIKAMGVTHVQLLPVNAWYFGNELEMGQRELHYSTRNNRYNWGYDPQNYFSVDGAYSEDPRDPLKRIKEFKELVEAIHEAGMAVIVDVVYTHMAKACFLDDIVPNYYFFQDSSGAFVGDFGCNLATNRHMAKKLMVDSVRHWFSEYGIDGMRFDMMGDATRDAVQQAFYAAKEINPKVIFLGEGWRTFKGHLDTPALAGQGADQDWMNGTNDVGVFSDEVRNELKSGFGCEGEPRFLTGGARDIAGLFKALKGQPGNTPADAPGDMVEYIAAHDNLPLYDVIAQSIKKDPEIADNDREIHRRVRIGNLLILAAQGTAFIHAGQEYGRTKQWLADGRPEHKYHELADEHGKPFRHPYFIHDSYDSSDAVNRFDWSKATDGKRYPQCVQTRDYTRGLIALRRSSDAFRQPTQELVERNVRLVKCTEIGTKDLVMAWTCRASDGTTFHCFVNADSRGRRLTLSRSLADATVVADGERVDPEGLSSPMGFTLGKGAITIEPLTAVVFRVTP